MKLAAMFKASPVSRVMIKEAIGRFSTKSTIRKNSGFLIFLSSASNFGRRSFRCGCAIFSRQGLQSIGLLSDLTTSNLLTLKSKTHPRTSSCESLEIEGGITPWKL